MAKIPQDNRWSQNNRSEIFGSLWSSFNLDLTSNEGKVRVSPRTIITTDNITDLGVPVVFQTFTDTNAGIQYVWTVAGSFVFRMAVSVGYQTAFAKDSATGTPTGADTNTSTSSDLSDLVNIGKLNMILTLRTRVYFYTASTGQWLNVQYDSGGTPTGVVVSDNTVHMMANYAGRTYITDENTKVRSVDNDDLNSASPTTNLTTSGSNFLDLANQDFPITSISTIRSVSDGIWVFTINQSEKGCVAFKWDGETADDPNEKYIIPDASGVLAAVIKDDTPWIIDNNGQLRIFNGGTFITTQEAGLANGKLPAKNTKLLKNSLSAVNDRWIHPNGMTTVDGRVRILVNNEYEDNGATIEENLPSGVWEYDPQMGWYHLMSLSLYVSSINDYGQIRVSRVGALYAAKTETTDASANGTMLMGAQLFSDATTTKEAILIDDSNDTVQKYGHLITTEIHTDNFDEVWQEIIPRFRKLLNANNKIVVKYRTEKEDPVEATITWVDTNTCTSTTDVSAYENFEMEVIQGDGSGKTAEITSVTNNAGTYTIELDDTFTGATTNTAKARFQKWKKVGEVTEQDVQLKRFSIDEPAATKIQLKICMQFQGEDELHDIFVESAKNQ